MLTASPTEKTPFLLPETHSLSNYDHGKETAHSHAQLTTSFAEEIAPEITSAQNGVKNDQTSGEDLPDEVEKAAASTVIKTVSV